jgi:hypothetical protein
MSLWPHISQVFARLVSIAIALLGAWILIRNVTGRNYEGWVLAYILLTSLLGLVGGTLYVLTMDGPQRFHTSTWRMWGWWLMLVSVIYTTINVIAVPLVALVFPGLPWMRDRQEKPSPVRSS